MWIRQVLVPGYTDSEEDLLKLKDFLSTLSNVQKVEILPYHDLGKFKWENLGVHYPLDDIRTATNEDFERAKKILRYIKSPSSGPFYLSKLIFYSNPLYSFVFLLQWQGYHLEHLLL